MVYRARLHFFLFAQPVIVLLLGWWLCGSQEGLLHFGGIFLLVVGAVSLLQRILIKMGSVYAVTNKRVILKTGIIRRRSLELVLAKCEGLQIRQSIWGRMLNYGTITVNTAGAVNSYPFIADPLRFKKEINEQIG